MSPSSPWPKSKSHRCDCPHQKEPPPGTPGLHTGPSQQVARARGTRLLAGPNLLCLLPGNPNVYWWVLLVLGIFVITVTVIACKKRKLESERPCGKMPSQPHRELRDGDRELGGPDEACGMQPGSLCDWGASPCLQRGSGTEPCAACPLPRQGFTPEGCCFGGGGGGAPRGLPPPVCSQVSRFSRFPRFPSRLSLS